MIYRIFFYVLLACVCFFNDTGLSLKFNRKNTYIKHLRPQAIEDEPCEFSKRTCISIWKCPYYIELFHKSQQLGNPFRMQRRNLCGLVDKRTPKVCCPFVDSDVINIRSDHTENMIEELNPKIKKLPLEKCGPILTTFRITKGSKAVQREFPWMALIASISENGNFSDFKCGGTLITDRYVLTAAHCLSSDLELTGVRLGEHDTAKSENCTKSKKKCEPTVLDIPIAKVKLHEKYNPVTQENDIGLIKLAKRVNYTDYIKPICLPYGPLSDVDLNGEEATVAGWGITETGNKNTVLHKVEVPVMSYEKCQSKHKQYQHLSKNQICAGGKDGKDSCSGDSGGPLKYVSFFNGYDRYIQHGIVSYGPKLCGSFDIPAVYTKVGAYMTWILDNIDSSDPYKIKNDIF